MHKLIAVTFLEYSVKESDLIFLLLAVQLNLLHMKNMIHSLKCGFSIYESIIATKNSSISILTFFLITFILMENREIFALIQHFPSKISARKWFETRRSKHFVRDIGLVSMTRLNRHMKPNLYQQNCKTFLTSPLSWTLLFETRPGANVRLIVSYGNFYLRNFEQWQFI